MPAQQLLDAIQSLAAIEAPIAARYVEQLAAELPSGATHGELAASDATLAAALAHVDATATRVMRIRLDHALAGDSSIEPATRRVFAYTVVSYAGKLGLLQARARDVAARGRARDPDELAALVVEAARATLVWHDELRVAVLVLARDRAAAAIAQADASARDRRLAEPERKRWSALRRELEAIAADPVRIASAPLATRLAAHAEQLDEPEPAREPTLAELIELD